MDLRKSKLVDIASAVKADQHIDAELAKPFLEHSFEPKNTAQKVLRQLPYWISFLFASTLVVYPEVGEWLVAHSPSFLELPPRVASSLDFVWGLFGSKVKQTNLIYHIPTIIVFAFGAAGIRKLAQNLGGETWKDKVRESQNLLKKCIEEGTAKFNYAPGFSCLFVGSGDRIGHNLVRDNPDIGVTLSSIRPTYTDFWSEFTFGEGDEEMAAGLARANSAQAGEYVLFPVNGDNLFLPGANDYDLAPHQVDIAIRRIRTVEESLGWSKKRVVIVGDRWQETSFRTTTVGENASISEDHVTLDTLREKYKDLVVIDPTDEVLNRVIELAEGREIQFRASEKGIAQYGEQFYKRLKILGYEKSKPGTLTVGYDLTDTETQHQFQNHSDDDFLPIILSREAFDELQRKGVKEGRFIFVPRLVKRKLEKIVAER